eukprot:Sro12_g009230.1 n/a (646) ;mRNA; r:44372-46309
MRYLACSKIEKPNVAREVVELWRKLDPPGRFLARKEDTTGKKGDDGGSGQVVWVEVPDKKAREKASQCLRERTPDVVPYIRQLREQQDQMTEHGVTMVQHQLKMQREAEAQKNSLHGMASAAADYTRRNSMAEHNPYQNPMAMGMVGMGGPADYGSRRTSMPMANGVGSMDGMQMMQQQQQEAFNRRQSAPHLMANNADGPIMTPSGPNMMGQMPGHYGMMEPAFAGSMGAGNMGTGSMGADMYDPAYASSMTAMQLQQHHQQMQLQQMHLQQQQLQLQMQHQQQMQMSMGMHQGSAHMNMRMPHNGGWGMNMQPVGMPSGPPGTLPNHSGHQTLNQSSSHHGSSTRLNNDASLNSQRSRVPDAPTSAQGTADVPAPDQSTSANFEASPKPASHAESQQSPRKSTKEMMKVLSGHDRTPKQPRQGAKKKATQSVEESPTKKTATPKGPAPDPPANKAPDKTPMVPTRLDNHPAPAAVTPEDHMNAPLPLDAPASNEDDHGELTLEEYRKTLESYMVSNNIQAQNPSYYSDEDDLSVESFPDWPDEADRREDRPEGPKRSGPRAAPNARQVDRKVSGHSMMSTNTFKSNTTSLSGLSMLSDMMSMTSGSRGDKMRDSRRFSSNASIMSELTDISHTIDGLGLDDDC